MGELGSIDVTRVPNERRLDFLPQSFGVRRMLRGESLVYAWMRALASNYTGGYWRFSALSNGGFYMAPECAAPVTLRCENGFEGSVSADAAGIVATLYALCQLAGETSDDDLIEKYHLLREFALSDHAERDAIASAID